MKTSNQTEENRWLPEFRGGPWLPLLFVGVFSIWVLFTNLSLEWLAGSDPSQLVEALANVPSRLVQLAIVLLVLRYEGIKLADIGFRREQLLPALITVVAFLIALHVAVIGLIVLDGGQLALDPFGLYRDAPLEYSVTAIVATGMVQYLLVGPVEELAFRGYLQNKLLALFGKGSVRLQMAIAIVGAAIGFSLLHLPALIVTEGSQFGAAIGSLLLLTLSGITFGTMYALTRNLVLVSMLHGIGNFWPLLVDPGIGLWPNWGIIIPLYALAVVLYRQWVLDVDSTVQPQAVAD